MQNYATEELLNGSISVSRSFVPSSRCQLDKTIEETIMKHAKSHNQASGGKGGGLFGVENFLTYCLTISLQNYVLSFSWNIEGTFLSCYRANRNAVFWVERNCSFLLVLYLFICVKQQPFSQLKTQHIPRNLHLKGNNPEKTHCMLCDHPYEYIGQVLFHYSVIREQSSLIIPTNPNILNCSRK